MSKVKFTGNNDVKIVFVRISVKSESTYVKQRPAKLSSIHMGLHLASDNALFLR